MLKGIIPWSKGAKMTEFLRITIHVLEIIFFLPGMYPGDVVPGKVGQHWKEEEEKLSQDDAHYQEKISKASLSKL